MKGLGRTGQLDALGQGLLPDVPCGAYTVELLDAASRGRGSWPLTVGEAEGEIQPFRAQALAIGAIRARVLDAEGRPVPMVESSLFNSGIVRLSDLAGEAVFDGVAEGTWTVCAAGAESVSARVEREGGEALALLRLRPVGAVKGRVSTPFGQPVAYAEVQVAGRKSATDAEGRFSLEGIPIGQEFRVMALTAAGRAGLSAPFTLAGGGEAYTVDFSLQAMGTVTGRFTDPLREEAPLNLQIELGIPGISETRKAGTGNQGEFRLESLPVGVPLSLDAYFGEGHVRAHHEVITLEAEGQVLDLQRVLAKRVHLKGWTLDGERRKVPMSVSLQDGTGRELGRVVTTGADFDPDHPTFFFPFLEAGIDYRLLGSRGEGVPATARLDFRLSGDNPLEYLELVEAPLGDLLLQLRYPDGSPAPGPGRFRLDLRGELPRILFGELDALGRARIQGLPAGSLHLQVEGVPNQPTFELDAPWNPSASEQEQAIRVRGLGQVTAFVRTASGRMLQGGRLSVLADASRWQGVALDGGGFRFEGVWAGVPLRLEAEGYPLVGASPAFQLEGMGQAIEVMCLAQDQGAVLGRVQDPAGNPVVGARVSLGSRAILTDGQGRFRFEGLPLGSHTLRAQHPDRPEYGIQTLLLSQDGAQVEASLQLKGLGSVTVSLHRAQGEAIPGQEVLLVHESPWASGQSWRALTDANGLARFTEIPEGTLRASTGMEVSAVSGLLVAGGSLALDLRSRDRSRLSGRITRGGSGLSWPVGSVLLLGPDQIGLQADGGLMGAPLEVNWTEQTLTPIVQIPGGLRLDLSPISLACNGDTRLDLTAPSFGTLRATVRSADGDPAAGLLMKVGGQGRGETDAQGRWSCPVLPGHHRVEAVGPGSLALGEAELESRDGAEAVLDLVLESDIALLPQTLTLNRLGTQVRIRAEGSDRFGISAALPAIQVDGAPAQALSAPGGLARWREKNRSLGWSDQMGPLAWSLIQGVGADGLLLREEIRLENTDAVPHRVQLIQSIACASEPRGLDSGAVPPVLAGEARDLGFSSPQGTVFWGDGPLLPQRLESGQLTWPELSLAPGEVRRLALAHAPYGLPAFRVEGALRLRDRILQGAPEWLQGLDTSPWDNWTASRLPSADALPPWDARACLRLVDAGDRPYLNEGGFTLEFSPLEVLAPVRSLRGGAWLEGVPADGGDLKVQAPWATDSRRITQPLGGEIRIPVPQGATLELGLVDNQGAPVAGQALEVQGVPVRTDAEGLVLPLLLSPGRAPVSGLLEGSWGLVEIAQNLELTAGANPRAQLRLPALGSLSLNLLGPDGTPWNGGGWSVTLRQGWLNRTATAQEGASGLEFPKLPTGTWELQVRDPRTQGMLPVQSVGVPEGGRTAISLKLPWTGRVAAWIHLPSGQAAGAGVSVTLRGSDGAQLTRSTDPSGCVRFDGVCTGPALVTAIHPLSGFPVSTPVQVLDQGVQELNLELPGSGSLSLAVATADGRPVTSRNLEVVSGGRQLASGRLDGAGRLILGPLPLGQELGLRELRSGSDWDPVIPPQSLILDRDGQERSMILALPVGRLAVAVTEAGSGSPLAGILLGCGPLSATTDARGQAVFLDVPLGRALTVRSLDSAYIGSPLGGLVLSESAPVGSGALALSHGASLQLRVIRANGEPGPTLWSWWDNSYRWTWTDPDGGVQTRAGGNPTWDLSLLKSGRHAFKVEVPVGLGRDGGLYRPGLPGWSWAAAGSLDLPLEPAQSTLDLRLPALASLNLHLRSSEGGALNLDRELRLRCIASTQAGYAAAHPVLFWNPTRDGADLTFGEHFPVGTHTLALFDPSGLELGRLDLSVRPEDDGQRLDRTLSPVLPVLASLRLHLRDLQGRPLALTHWHTLRLKSSSLAGWNPDFGNWLADDSEFPASLPQGTHRLTVSDSVFGELAEFEVRVGAGDGGITVERTLNLPYTRRAWTVQVLAGDHETPALGAWVQIRDSLGGIAGILNPGETTLVEAPIGTSLQAWAGFSPWNQPEFIEKGLSRLQSLDEESVAETLELPLTVLRLRLMDLDGSTPINEAQAEPGAPASPDQGGLAVFPAWGDPVGGTWLLVLGQPVGSRPSLKLYDPDSGLGCLIEPEVPRLGTHLELSPGIPAYAWLESLAFKGVDGAEVQSTRMVGISAGASGLVRPDLARWVFNGELPTPWGPGDREVRIDPSGAAPDWADCNTTRNRVRIPAQGTLWGAAFTVSGDGCAPGPFAFQAYTRNPGEASSFLLQAQPWTWRTVYFRLVDGAEQPIGQWQELRAQPQDAPSGWRIGVGIDPSIPEQAVELPLDLPLRLELLPAATGDSWTGAWSLMFDAQNAAPGPQLKADHLHSVPPEAP